MGGVKDGYSPRVRSYGVLTSLFLTVERQQTGERKATAAVAIDCIAYLACFDL